MPSNPSQTLEQALGVSDAIFFDTAFVQKLVRLIETRFLPLEGQRADLDEAIEAVKAVGLDRINEVLTPAIQSVLTIQERGFLIANSTTSNTLGVGNVLTFNIDDEDERAVFTPSRFVFLSRLSNTDDWGIARLYSYDNTTGVLVVTVTAYEGNVGPFTDWQVSAVAGSTVAQMALLDLAEALYASTIAARDTTVSATATAVASAATSTTQAGIATTGANTATTQAGIATTKAAEAAASAASILGGPVTSVNLKTGVVFLDPTDVTAVKATLDLDLTSKWGAPFIGNLTRATAGGHRMNSKGVLVPTVADEPLVDHLAAGTSLGTGFFGAYTNQILRAEEFENAAWTLSAATITANATASPDGATTADKLVENSATSDHSIRNATAFATGSGSYTLSVYAKAAERSQLRLVFYEGGNIGGAYFDLSAGTILSGSGGIIEDVGKGWYRCSMTATVPTGAAFFAFIMPAVGGVSTYLGNGASGLYVFGDQVTKTAFPVPYVPTTSASVTRNADSMTITGTDFTDFFNPVEGTFLCEFYVDAGRTSLPVLFEAGDGTSANRIVMFHQPGSSLIHFDTIVGAVSQGALNRSFTTGLGKAAYSYKANAFNMALGGSSPAADVSGSLPTGLDRLAIGKSAGVANAEFNNRIRRLIYWPRAHTSTDLQRMTA